MKLEIQVSTDLSDRSSDEVARYRKKRGMQSVNGGVMAGLNLRLLVDAHFASIAVLDKAVD